MGELDLPICPGKKVDSQESQILKKQDLYLLHYLFLL